MKGKTDDKKHTQSHPAKEGSCHIESALKKEPHLTVAKIKSCKTKEQILKITREKMPKIIKFLNDFSQRTLQKRREQIPKKKGRKEKRKDWFFDNGQVGYLCKDKKLLHLSDNHRILALTAM